MVKRHAPTLPAGAAAAAATLLLMLLALTSFKGAEAWTWKCQKGWEVAGWNSCRTCKPNYVIAATLTSCKYLCTMATRVGKDPNAAFVQSADCEFVVYNMKGECYLRNSWNDGPDGKTVKQYGTIACRKVDD